MDAFLTTSKALNTDFHFMLDPVLQIPVRASRHGPLADFFQQTGPVLVREAVQKWAFLEQNNAKFQN